MLTHLGPFVSYGQQHSCGPDPDVGLTDFTFIEQPLYIYINVVSVIDYSLQTMCSILVSVIDYSLQTMCSISNRS